VTSPRTALRVAVPAVVVVIAVEAIVSIAARWPYQWGGHGDPDKVLSEFVGHGGTALAPPLFLLVLLALVALGVQRRDRWGTVATVVLVPVSAILAVGAAGEATATPTADVSRAVLVAGGIFGTVVSLGLLALAVASLVVDRQQRRATSATGAASAAAAPR